MDKYEYLQKKCIDPLRQHSKAITANLKTLSKKDADQLNVLTDVSVRVIPGQKMCYKYLSNLNAPKSPSMNQTEEVTLDYGLSGVPTLNTSLEELGVSPLRTSQVSNMSSYAKRKVTEVNQALVMKISSACGVPTSTLQECSNCKDLDILMDLLKEKNAVSPRHLQTQLLTLAPDSWSVRKIAETFKVSPYMVRTARKLRQEHGILAEPSARRASTAISSEIELRVKTFYESDEHSRILPGAKDYKSVKSTETGKREHKQKCLILMNLNELYENYKAKFPDDKIGFSKFCLLRPSHCITVGSRGTHSVCVCQAHQNIKLMLTALPSAQHTITYHDLMSKIVCSVTSKLCMVHRCPSCPGVDVLRSYLEDISGLDDTTEDSEVSFKQWMSTDRTTIQTCSSTLADFVETIVKKTDELTSHHFIWKHQGAFLSTLKEQLKQNEAIIILDFAENYSFVVQDAVQGYHWENSQATIHPFVAYFRDETDELHHECMCVISDCLQHDTVTVHRFQNDVLSHLRKIAPQVSKISYFSDGASSQYKNFKNFANLVYHHHDFGFEAEWHFFATSHGKNVCDGVGGTIKREAAKASL